MRVFISFIFKMSTAAEVFRREYVEIVGNWARGKKCNECGGILVDDWEPMWFISFDQRQFDARLPPGDRPKYENGMFGPSKRSLLRLFEQNNSKYVPAHSMCHQRTISMGLYAAPFPPFYQEWRNQVDNRFEIMTGYDKEYIAKNFRWHGPLEMGTLYDRRDELSAKKHVEKLFASGGSFVRVKGSDDDLTWHNPNDLKNKLRREEREAEYLGKLGKANAMDSYKTVKKLRSEKRQKQRKDKEKIAEPAPPPANLNNN